MNRSVRIPHTHSIASILLFRYAVPDLLTPTVTGNSPLESPITWCFLWLVPIGISLVMDRKKEGYHCDNSH